MDIKDEVIEEIMKDNIINIGTLDEFLNYLPRDVVDIIYQYQYPFCELCDRCCNVCKFYCYLECLRYDNRDVCCKGEFNTTMNRYSYRNPQTEDESPSASLLENVD